MRRTNANFTFLEPQAAVALRCPPSVSRKAHSMAGWTRTEAFLVRGCQLRRSKPEADARRIPRHPETEYVTTALPYPEKH